MHKCAFALLVITITILPSSLMASDEDPIYDQMPPGVVHFKDGRSPTIPVTTDAGTGDNEGYPPYFRPLTKGTAHASVPAQSSKHPSR